MYVIGWVAVASFPGLRTAFGCTKERDEMLGGAWERG